MKIQTMKELEAEMRAVARGEATAPTPASSTSATTTAGTADATTQASDADASLEEALLAA